MGPWGEYGLDFCIFIFSMFMLGPYFSHLWPSLVNLEAVLVYGLVVDDVDNNSFWGGDVELDGDGAEAARGVSYEGRPEDGAQAQTSERAGWGMGIPSVGAGPRGVRATHNGGLRQGAPQHRGPGNRRTAGLQRLPGEQEAPRDQPPPVVVGATDGSRGGGGIVRGTSPWHRYAFGDGSRGPLVVSAVGRPSGWGARE